MPLFPPEFLNLISPILPFLNEFWKVFEIWWWVFPPFLLWGTFKHQYIFWRQVVWDSTIPKIVIEIKLPEIIEKPIKAMDYVFAGLHAMHDITVWREKYIEGQFQMAVSLEIVSIDGKVHFFMRLPEMFRDIVESNIYSQYPEVEITQVEDYSKQIPMDIPNKEWDLFGMSWKNSKENFGYPMKTYLAFENEAERLEGRIVDPLAGLLEALGTLTPGEQAWMQIICKPIRDNDTPWIKKALEERDKLVRRPGAPPPPPPMITEAIQVVVTGKPTSMQEQEKDIIPPEMKLTPGEREIVQAIEQKISKFAYSCAIRTIYLGKKDAFFKARARSIYGFFKAISTENMGGFKPDKITMTKTKSIPLWFLDKRRTFLKKKKLIRYYRGRWTPFFPMPGGTFILNTEELATLYHFPSGGVAPTSSVERVGTRKREAPKGLPVE